MPWLAVVVEAQVNWWGRSRTSRARERSTGRSARLIDTDRSRRSRRRGRALLAGGLAATLLAGLTACGADSGTPTLMWYINPDAGGQAEFAKKCTQEAGGDYRIQTALLPREASQQREQLIRRLAAKDSSIAMISLDPIFVAEFAKAGFLKTLPKDMAAEVTDDVVQSSIDSSTWDGDIVAAPFWANTQLLWYRKSMAKKAGLDMSKPVTWDQLIDAAKRLDSDIAAQGIRAEALTVWVNALIASAGGQIVQNPEADADQVKLGLDSPAGKKAAEIIGTIGREGLSGSAFSTEDEDAGATMFENGDAFAMVNWPFVYARAKGKAATEDEDGKPKKPEMDPKIFEDYGWAPYPTVEAGTESKSPLGGINIGIGAYTPYADEAYDAVRCVVTAENQAYYMETNGNPAAKKSAYDDPDVREAYPSADLIRKALDGAEPRPITPYYNEISEGIQRTWHPPNAVRPGTTPKESADLITKVLRKEELL